MAEKNTQVGLARRDHRRDNVFTALDLVRQDVVCKLAPQVLLKPNFLSSTEQLASTHVDAIRGAIDFLLSTPAPPEEIIVAEGGNEKYSGEAFDHFGYRALLEEYPVPIRLVDLNQEERWQETTIFVADRSEITVRMPKTVLECPCTISVAVAKTHDVCCVTLAQKNMIMGTICREDRIKMHGYPSHAERVLPTEAQRLNINLIRLAQYLRPDIAVIDGTVGLEGNGPLGTEVVDWGVAIAGADVFAADAVTAAAMGFEPMELGLLHYADALGYGTADLQRIEVVGATIEEVRQPFKRHETTDLQLQWQDERAVDFLVPAAQIHSPQ